MKLYKALLICVAVFIVHTAVNAQAVATAINQSKGINSSELPYCGSHDYTQKLNQINSNYSILSDQMMTQIKQVVDAGQQNRDAGDLFIVPVVFHVLYNNAEENLPDSVIFNQLDLLNASFRRRNADTVNTRSDFDDIVGDAKIEFVLADQDPTGIASTGIVRTNTTVANFGGILPYGPGQTQQIADWVSDSLFANMFRMTRTADGGSDPWDEDRYLNIWIGDLRIFEPQFNNFEELIFFGLATPPDNHINWVDSAYLALNLEADGVIMHYVSIGSNNPNIYPPDYAIFNGIATTGKMLVHEVGHYLGLRHIWGDGDCSMDDYVSDTPNNSAQTNFNCPVGANGCIDNINGVDLPNMIENYMDYSSGTCQNAFTRGQVGVMRDVLYNYRINLPEVISTVGVVSHTITDDLLLYPNPSTGEVFFDFGNYSEALQVKVMNANGQVVYTSSIHKSSPRINLNAPVGLYFVQLIDERENSQTIKLVLH